MIFLKEFFQKINFEKNQQTTKKHENLPSMQMPPILATGQGRQLGIAKIFVKTDITLSFKVLHVDAQADLSGWIYHIVKIQLKYRKQYHYLAELCD